MTLLELHRVANCLPQPDIVLKRPRFYSFSDSSIVEMVTKAGQSWPLPAPTEGKVQILAVESEFKMQAFYDNWQSPSHLGNNILQSYSYLNQEINSPIIGVSSIVTT